MHRLWHRDEKCRKWRSGTEQQNFQHRHFPAISIFVYNASQPLLRQWLRSTCFTFTSSVTSLAVQCVIMWKCGPKSAKWTGWQTGTNPYSWPYPTHEAEFASDPDQPPMRQGFFWKTGTNSYSWPHPTYKVGPDPNRPTRPEISCKGALIRTPDPIRPTRWGPLRRWPLAMQWPLRSLAQCTSPCNWRSQEFLGGSCKP